MINEDFCSFEVAKLLKEKGFDEPCYRWYNTKGNVCAKFINPDISLDYSSREYYLCPSQSMAMKWLREVYKLEVRSTYDYDKDSWWGNINPMFEETDENTNVYQKALRFDYQGKSYEEAVEAALKYSLENLI